jgi:5-methylcytosine-specific restriction protein A
MPKAAKTFRPKGWTAPARNADSRPNFRRRGYGAAWDKARLVFIAAHPLCVECERKGLLVAAYAVDHIVPHRGDMKVFWDYDNWQSLCRSCHARKSRSEQLGPARGGGGSNP